MTDTLTAAPVTRIQPDTYHARTGHTLKPEKSHVYNQLMKTSKYAKENQMVINEKKTKLRDGFKKEKEKVNGIFH